MKSAQAKKYCKKENIFKNDNLPLIFNFKHVFKNIKKVANQKLVPSMFVMKRVQDCFGYGGHNLRI